MLLFVTDSLPLLQTAFSIICHIVYLQNFSTYWPLISLSSASFIASCAMAIVNHFLWFIHFSRLARDVRQTYRHRASVPNAPGFTDIATFFGLCVWLVPLFLFLSLSANDHALPTSSGTFHVLYVLGSNLIKCSRSVCLCWPPTLKIFTVQIHVFRHFQGQSSGPGQVKWVDHSSILTFSSRLSAAATFGIIAALVFPSTSAT